MQTSVPKILIFSVACNIVSIDNGIMFVVISGIKDLLFSYIEFIHVTKDSGHLSIN